MDRYERILTLHRLLKNARFAVPLSRLLDELGCSRATLYRDVAFLRDALGAPLESSGGDQAAFRYSESEGERFELPGLWLTSEELAAILALNELIGRADPGVLSSALAPFKSRIEHLMAGRTHGNELPLDRIRVVPYGSRRLDEHAFRIVAGAVLQRRRLTFSYRARTTDNDNVRHVSPQRLTHYRDNWYLDTFDHDRDALRSFAVDRIRDARVEDAPVRDVDAAELDATLASSYGIFAGAPKAWATVRFSAHAARWVADEHWHSEQQGSWLPDGRYELRLPYSSPRELLRDVMKYGADAEVVAPIALREEMKIQLQLAQGIYA
ncbi:MAG TPA: YafY family protein [Rhodanobacteraceae bacterium]